MKRILKIVGVFLGIVILLLVIAIWMVSTERYQNILTKKATDYLSEKLHTKVEVNHIKLNFFNEFTILGVYVEDEKKDTLAYVGNLNLKTSELLSNYWNDETSVIKHVELENVFVNLKRAKDTTRWNYDFISEAFASDTKKDSTIVRTDTSTSSNNPKLDLKKLTLKNVRFEMNDAWRGEDMRYGFESLVLDISKMDLSNSNFEINSLAIDGAKILVREFVGGKPKDLTPDDISTWGTPFNPDLARLNVKSIQLKNTSFAYEDGDDIPLKNEFNERHLGIQNINIELENTQIVADTIFSKINSLSLKERCGLEIKELHADLKLSQVQSVLSNLYLQTNNSVVGNRFEMDYKNFHDFNDFIDQVVMKGNLEKSKVSSIDVAYFANILNQYPISIDIDGNVEGTVRELHGTNLNLATRNTRFQGDATVIGLPDIDNTFFKVNATDLKTTGDDINQLIPQTRVDAIAWKELKSMQFKGSYSGKVDDFKTTGSLNTNLGNAVVDLAMNLKPKIPEYKGKIQTDGFNIGKLLKQSTVGIIAMDGQIDGKGFDLNSVNTKVLATVKRIDLNGTTYKDLTINGLVANKKFDGIFVSQDPSLAINFNGKVDLSGKDPSYNFTSRFIRFNLQKLGLTKEPIIGSGYASLNFQGNNIDNFTGSAEFTNVVIENNDQKVSIPHLLLESLDGNSEKILHLQSTMVDASLVGQYKISELSNALLMYLHHYLPQYIKKPNQYLNQKFVFNANIKKIDTLLQTFLPSLKGLDSSSLNAELNTYNQKLGLDIVVPNVGYNDMDFKDVVIVGAGDFSSLDLNANCGNFLYNEDVIIPSFQVNSTMAADTASLSIFTQSINDLLGEASLACKATANNGNLYVNVLPSKINIKNDPWQLYSKGDLIFGKQIIVNDFIIESGAQRIVVNTENSNVDDLIVTLKDIDLESISDYTNSVSPRYYGRIDGTIRVNDFVNHPKVVANVFSNNEVRVDQDTVGLVNAKFEYDVENKRIEINSQSGINREGKTATIGGYIDIKDSTINVKATLDQTSISFVNQFISEYIQGLRGFATGEVNVKGRLSDPKIAGTIQVDNAALKVLFLGTTYYIDNTNFNFTNKKIEIAKSIIRDERGGSQTGSVQGTITHNNFSDMYLNLKVKSDDLLCLNTNQFQSDLFYGYVPAKVAVDLTGPMDDIYLDIDAKPLKGSKFYLPINSSGDASTYDYITFAKFGRGQIEEKIKSSNYVKINMKIDATPDAEVFIILDQNTGEEIQANGEGAIRLVVDLGNSIEMYGNYVISKGKYNFNFRGLFPKEFAIDEGSKISWNGDALEAKLDVKAIYKLEKPLPLYPLVSNIAESLSESDKEEAKRTYSTYVTILLNGNLSSPDIKFDVTQPDNKSVGTAAYSKLEQIRNDEKELTAQAGVLLLLDQFKSPDGLTSSSYGQGAISSVSDLVGSAVSSEITNQFQKLTGLNKVSINVGYQNLGTDANAANRNQLSMNLSAPLFNDRVIVDFGNSVDIGKNTQGTTTSNFNFIGDFKAQYLITPDGKLRANAFRTNNVDLENRNYTRGGVGVSYKIVFNSFKDLFRSKKKKKKLEDEAMKDTTEIVSLNLEK